MDNLNIKKHNKDIDEDENTELKTVKDIFPSYLIHRHIWVGMCSV